MNKVFQYYLLDDAGKVIGTNDYDKYKIWSKQIKCPLTLTIFTTQIDTGTSIQTIFEADDFDGAFETPLTMFQTTVFRTGPYNGYVWRYASYREACKGHWRMVDKIKNKLWQM